MQKKCYAIMSGNCVAVVQESKPCPTKNITLVRIIIFRGQVCVSGVGYVEANLEKESTVLNFAIYNVFATTEICKPSKCSGEMSVCSCAVDVVVGKLSSDRPEVFPCPLHLFIFGIR